MVINVEELTKFEGNMYPTTYHKIKESPFQDLDFYLDLEPGENQRKVILEKFITYLKALSFKKYGKLSYDIYEELFTTHITKHFFDNMKMADFLDPYRYNDFSEFEYSFKDESVRADKHFTVVIYNICGAAGYGYKASVSVLDRLQIPNATFTDEATCEEHEVSFSLTGVSEEELARYFKESGVFQYQTTANYEEQKEMFLEGVSKSTAATLKYISEALNVNAYADYYQNEHMTNQLKTVKYRGPNIDGPMDRNINYNIESINWIELFVDHVYVIGDKKLLVVFKPFMKVQNVKKKLNMKRTVRAIY